MIGPLTNGDAAPQGPSRRRLLGVALGSLGAGAAAAAAASCTPHLATYPSAPSSASDVDQQQARPVEPSIVTPPAPGAGQPVPAAGTYQAGVVTPVLPQSQLLLAVYDIKGAAGPLLADLGVTILSLTAGTDPRLLGIDPGDLTITVGLGPAVVAVVDPSLPGTHQLPSFAREVLNNAGSSGGDLMLQVCGSDPLVIRAALAALEIKAGDRITEKWRQRGARGPYQRITGAASAPRNVLGFVDGIIGPRTAADLVSDVWLPGPLPVAGGTIMVVRRMIIDVDGFAALPIAEQEAIVGRRRAGAEPLSGGTIADGIDLQAKTPEGAYVVPAAAHSRRAHALTIGVPLMLRRSYSIDEPNLGLLFISFQNSLHTFTATMTRMSVMDALIERTTTTATGTFLVLPGFSKDRPLGAGLFST